MHLRASARQADQIARNQAVGGLNDARLGIEHIEHVRSLEAGALADLKIVEVVPP